MATAAEQNLTEEEFMGCDIHSFAERKNEDGIFECISGVSPFDRRSYSVFGYLANVRNYSAAAPISAPRGIPSDASKEVADEHDGWGCDAHSASWLLVAELLAIDPNMQVEDRRCMRNNNGGSTCDIGEGEKKTLREFLGDWFFCDIAMLRDAGADRVVFWFDN